MAPVTRRKRLSEQAELEANTPEVTPSKSTEKLPLRGKGAKASKGSDETEAAEPSSATPTKTAKNNKTVFNDDDDDISAPVVTKKPAPAPAEPEQDDEDSDDEAPEAVSTVKAATEVKETAKASKKAAQEQAATQKRKRQERDALLKQQAEERKKADALAAPVAAAVEEQEEEEPAQDRQIAPTSTRKRAEKIQFPNLLPAEFLSSDDEEEQQEDEASHADESRRQKRRKVSGIERNLARQNRGPGDEAIGSTVYRVAKKTDDRFAPKVKQYTKSTKELLLKRNRVAAKPRGGFLAKKR